MKLSRIAPFALLLALIALPVLAQDVALGSAWTVGETWWYTQQTNTVGKQIARDAAGGVHFTWTKGADAANASRHAFYNFSSDDNDVSGQLAGNSHLVDEESRGGYAAIALITREQEQAAAVFYHGGGRAIMSYDFARGWGAFAHVKIALPGSLNPISVKGTIDHQGRTQVLAGTHFMDGSPGFPIALMRGTNNNDRWSVGAPNVIDTLTYLSHLVVASQESDKVAVVWHHNLVGVPAPQEWAGRTEYMMNADIYVAPSEDGSTWTRGDRINVTRTIPPDNDREGLFVYGDTLRPFSDLDAIYVNDVLHVVFTARGFRPDPTGEIAPPVDWISEVESFIWHWDSASDSITLVANGWYDNNGDPGPWDANVSRPSLGSDADGNLYCAFRKVTEDDQGANHGYDYGEICLSRSTDGGTTWTDPTVLTGTHNTRAANEYINECFPSIAERVDDFVHLTYLLVPETASRVEDEGLPAVAKMIYQRVAIGDLPDEGDLRMPRGNFTYHNLGLDAVADSDPMMPATFQLSGVYPNPFNSVATIKFTIPTASRARVTVSDLTGREVACIADGTFSAGSHGAVWSAEGMAAGVYLIRLESGGKFATIKAALVK